MAVIKIPSRNIFEIENDKYIDNAVSMITAKVKEVAIVNDTTNIYNETLPINSNMIEYDATKTNLNTESNASGMAVIETFAYISATPIYFTANFIVSKKQQGFSIIKILDGDDGIKISNRGNIKKGTAVGTMTRTPKTSGGFDDSINNVAVDQIISDTNDSSYVLDNELNYSYSYINGGKTYISDVTLTLDDKALAVTDEGNYWEVTANNLLVGYRVFSLGGGIGYNPMAPMEQTIPLNGTYEDYYPTELNFSAYGDIYRLGINEKDLVLGNGSKAITIVGNELIQSNFFETYPYKQRISMRREGSSVGNPVFTIVTNGYQVKHGDIVYFGIPETQGEVATVQADTTTNLYKVTFTDPSVGEKFTTTFVQASLSSSISWGHRIIDKWENGKETATLRCSISDYYDTDDNKVISASGYTTKQLVLQKIAGSYPTFIITNGVDVTMEDTIVYGSKNFELLAHNGNQIQFKDISLGYDLPNGSIINAQLVRKDKEDLPMMFNLGDIVQPYVYGSKGKDKPMSLNKDGTPKNFKVLSRKISDSGVIFQTIELQEV